LSRAGERTAVMPSARREAHRKGAAMNKVAVGLLVIIAALAGSTEPVPAWEHRGHRAFVHGFWGPRVFLGPPAFWYPYTPPPVIVEAAPALLVLL